jgi:hypothetical protein
MDVIMEHAKLAQEAASATRMLFPEPMLYG